MAIGIENYPNITAPDSDYPAGQIRDASPSVAPTPISVLTNGDIHQFFYKLLDHMAVTPSGDPDNVTNGYQYFDAFLNSILGGIYQAQANAAVLQGFYIVGANPLRVRFMGTKTVRFSGQTDSSNPVVVTVADPVLILPVGQRPLFDRTFIGIDAGTGALVPIDFIASTGQVIARGDLQGFDTTRLQMNFDYDID